MTEVVEQLEERVMDMVAKFLDVDRAKVSLTSDFVRDLGADSLDLVELVMALEDEFDREISDEQASNIRTVQDAVSFIREK